MGDPADSGIVITIGITMVIVNLYRRRYRQPKRPENGGQSIMDVNPYKTKKGHPLQASLFLMIPYYLTMITVAPGGYFRTVKIT